MCKVPEVDTEPTFTPRAVIALLYLQRLDEIAATFEHDADNNEELVKTCMTTLSSKM